MTAKQITVEQFTKELWEAQREDIRKSLHDAVSESDLDASFPAWDALPPLPWIDINIAKLICFLFFWSINM